MFSDYCRERGYILPKGRDDFTLAYDTNVPRQAGLSGSSAIACAAVNCLFAHYGVPLRVRPGRQLRVHACSVCQRACACA